MDELSLFAFAGTTSSSVESATTTDTVIAAPTPSDGDDFAAALKAVVPGQNDSDVDVGAAGAALLPIEAAPAPDEQKIETIDPQLVWAIDDDGFIAADRNRPFTDLTVPSAGDHAADDSRNSYDDLSSLLEFQTTAESQSPAEATALISTPNIAASTVSGQSVTSMALPDTQLPAPGAVSVAGTENVEVVRPESSDSTNTSLPAVTHISHTRRKTPQTLQQNVAKGVLDAQLTSSSQAAEQSTDALQHVPGPSVLSVPTAPTPRTQRIPTVLKLPRMSGALLSERVPAIPGSADLAVPRFPTTADNAGAAGKAARVPAILKTSTEHASTLALPSSVSEVTGITRPVNVTADLRSADVTTPTANVDEVLQSQSRDLSIARTVEHGDVTTIVLPSASADSGYSPRVNVPQPLTSQVLVAMAQNISVVKEQSSGTLTLRLDPPELGQMEVQFRQGEQGVELRLAARVPETLQMLMARGDEIKRVLNTMDLDLSKLEIAGEDSFRGGGESAAFEHRSSQHNDAEQQNQSPSLELQSEDNDQGRRPGGIRQSRQIRRRSGIRA